MSPPNRRFGRVYTDVLSRSEIREESTFSDGMRTCRLAENGVG